MGFNFPNAPVTGDASNGYVWDGEKWVSGTLGTFIYVSDSAPAAPVGALWWESDTGILFFKYNDGNSVQWVAISDGGAGAIRFDMPQTLTAAQQIVARQNVYAAPFDALAYNGMQINGSMEVSQEKGTAITTLASGTNVAYVVDGWRVYKTGTSVINAYQIVDGPVGYRNSIQLEATTAQVTIGTDVVHFRTDIEGYRICRLGLGTSSAASISVGFWARLSLTGTYRAIIYNRAGDAVSPWLPFTINASMTWQWITLQFPPLTSGTWPTDNNPSLVFEIEVASSSTPNTVGATSRYAAITGVVVLPGIEAPSAARSALIMRPYDQELVTCKRYFQQLQSGLQGVAQTTTIVLIQARFEMALRAAPTVSASAAIVVDDGLTGSATQSAATASMDYQDPSFTGGRFIVPNFTGLTSGRMYAIVSSAPGGRIKLDARL